MAGADVGVVDERLGAEHAQRELLLRHLEREDRNRDVGLQRRVRRDVEGERGLSHAGPAGNDDQIRALKARRQPVEVVEAGRHAGDQLFALIEPLDVLQRLHEEIAHLVERRAELLLRDAEDAALGIVEELLDVLASVVCLRRDLGAGRDQAAEDRFFLDDARVVRDVGGARHAIGELGDERRPADGLQLPLLAQRLAERHGVDRRAALGEIEHRPEDLAMRLTVEVVGPETDLDRAVAGVVVEEDAAEYEFFRFEVLRRKLTEVLFDRRHHHHPPGRARTVGVYERAGDKTQDESRRAPSPQARLLGAGLAGRREETCERLDGVGDAQPVPRERLAVDEMHRGAGALTARLAKRRHRHIGLRLDLGFVERRTRGRCDDRRERRQVARGEAIRLVGKEDDVRRRSRHLLQRHRRIPFSTHRDDVASAGDHSVQRRAAASQL